MTVQILVGHVLDRLRELPDESVHMVWTSPPYYGLRAYQTEPQVWGGDPECEHRWGDTVRLALPAGKQGKSSRRAGRANSKAQESSRERGCWCQECGAWRGEHGQEPSLALWLEHEVAIFREVRRVLRSDGTLWLNVGDAYASGHGGSSTEGKGITIRKARESAANPRARADVDVASWSSRDHTPRRVLPGFKPKDRMMLPARLAIALQDDGWWLRDEIVWAKRNPMPSSTKDRTCPAHEMLYTLSKRPRYFYDSIAIEEPAGWNPGDTKMPDGWATHVGSHGTVHREGREKGQRRRSGNSERKYGDERGRGGSHIAGSVPWEGSTRAKRSVWTITAEPFKAAHFATAPTALVAPCILAGTSRSGVCPECGAPWQRQVESQRIRDGQPISGDWNSPTPQRIGPTGVGHWRDKTVRTTVGWGPSCTCPEHEPIPATVLDPFGGSGTTGLVAGQLGRSAILIELNPEYAAMAEARIASGLVSVASDLPEPENPFEGLPLFEGASL